MGLPLQGRKGGPCGRASAQQPSLATGHPAKREAGFLSQWQRQVVHSTVLSTGEGRAISGASSLLDEVAHAWVHDLEA